MQFRFGRYAFLFSLLCLIGASLSIMPLMAQNEPIITIGIEEWQQQVFSEEYFDAFEEQYGAKVVLVVLSSDERYFGSPASVDDVAEFIEGVNSVASSADLIPMNVPGTLSNLHTRTGAYLDITPLMNADPNADLEDFYPAMLQSFQWEGGTWGLPISGSVQFIVYNKNVLDEAGVAYPDETWTLADYMNVGRELTVYGDDGEVEVPGFYGFDTTLLLRAEYGRSLYDVNGFDTSLNLSDPALISLVEDLTAFQEEVEPNFERGFSFDSIPITLGGIYYLDPTFNMGGNDVDWGATLLPNGTAGMYLQGYSISAGTANPQLAYELLQYMSKTPEIVYAIYGDVFARQSMSNAEPSGDTFFFRPELSPEAQELLDSAIAGAIPAPEIESFRQVQFAMFSVNDPEAEVQLDTAQALQEAEEEFNNILVAIEDTSVSNVLTVATPIPTPVLQTGELALRFGSESYFGPSSDQDLWRTAIEEFAAQDPEVRHVEISNEFLPIEQRAEEQDCFVLGYNAVPDMDLSLLRSLDPYLSADANYDPNIMLAGTMEQVSRDGLVWALPMAVSPIVMWYKPEAFEEAGLPMPSNDWTIYDWEDSMRQLYDGENAVFQSQNFGGQYILMLSAAYGGVPLDYSQQPYQILTDSNTIEATQYILDLAKEGLLDYQELSNFGGGGGGFGGEIPMFDAQLLPNDWRLQNREGEFADPYRVVMFPSGTQYQPLSYNLSIAAISAQSPAADACYRWLSFIAQRPELLNGMPAREDSFDAALQYITDGEDVVQLYRDFAEALRSPNALVLPSAFSGGGDNVAVAISNYVITLWVYQAFDNYVLEDGDLEADLLQGQSYLADFNTCVSGIEVRDLDSFGDDEEGQRELTRYYNQYLRCAVDVDPELYEMFQFSLEQEEE